VGEKEIKEKMAVMMGGRAAELLVYDEASTGASNDLERVTLTARRLVTEFGMTEALGPVRYANNVGMGGGYLGNVPGMQDDLSPETATLIDREVRRLVEESQDLALDLLKTNEAALHEVAQVLMEEEVISGEDIKDIAVKNGAEPSKVADQNGR
jgi:cell division protease FtsH